jgi:hypothetical protein
VTIVIFLKGTTEWKMSEKCRITNHGYGTVWHHTKYGEIIYPSFYIAILKLVGNTSFLLIMWNVTVLTIPFKVCPNNNKYDKFMIIESILPHHIKQLWFLVKKKKIMRLPILSYCTTVITVFELKEKKILINWIRYDLNCL